MHSECSKVAGGLYKHPGPKVTLSNKNLDLKNEVYPNIQKVRQLQRTAAAGIACARAPAVNDSRKDANKDGKGQR